MHIHRPRWPRLGRWSAAATLTAALVAAPSESVALPDDPWPYQWPVDAPVVDPFRPPATPFGRGNRGLEFGTFEGQVVRSAGMGVVLWAGPVGGRLHVTTAHADRLRISYSRLASLAVQRGDLVSAGQLIGTAGERLHVGARLGTAYLDPAIVFGGRRVVRLVPSRRPPQLRLHLR